LVLAKRNAALAQRASWPRPDQHETKHWATGFVRFVLPFSIDLRQIAKTLAENRWLDWLKI
jgi:hypothetical protein